MVSDNSKPLLNLSGISKFFIGVTALAEVDFELHSGEVHCLIGENGAGKSTLVKIIAGVYQPDEGQIFIGGKEINIQNTKHSQQLGLSFIFQELSVVNGLSVAENIVLGKEPRRGLNFDFADARRRAHDVLKQIGFGGVEPAAMVSSLSVAEKQAVMIARALFLEAKVIVMDEPTSSLDSDEVNELFSVIRKLRSEGKGIIYISHRMNEIFEIGDRVTVFKDGYKMGTFPVSEVNEWDLVRLMVGRQVNVIFPEKCRNHGEVVMRVSHLTTQQIENISFELHQGEILAIAGLVGSGRTELLRALFGVEKHISGTVTLVGEPKPIVNCNQAINAGMGLVPEDRRTQGIVPRQSVRNNLLMVWSQFPMIRRENSQETVVSTKLVEQLRIATPSIEQIIAYLSGGNQQKVVFGKWLAIQSKILLLDEPTRGIDVGAKIEIYRLIDQLTKEGMAVIFVSSELPEVLGMADRILVMRSGKIVAELNGSSTEEDVVAASMLTEEVVQ
jgi:ABC-type sugar transport system ATPase subunit